MVDGKLEFKEETKKDYDDVYLEHVPWENVYVNNTTLENSTEAIVIRHWERDEFIAKFAVNPLLVELAKIISHLVNDIITLHNLT